MGVFSGEGAVEGGAVEGAFGPVVDLAGRVSVRVCVFLLIFEDMEGDGFFLYNTVAADTFLLGELLNNFVLLLDLLLCLLQQRQQLLHRVLLVYLGAVLYRLGTVAETERSYGLLFVEGRGGNVDYEAG